MKRFLSLTAIVLVLMVAVIGCQQAPKVLKVAVLAPLSGPVPTFGVSTRDGALSRSKNGTPRVAFST
jgi:hypothetical protein